MSASFRVSQTGKLDDFSQLPRKPGKAGQLPLIKFARSATAGVMAKLTPHEVRSIAVAAMVDPRSVKKAITGQPLHALTMERIREALARLGRSDLLATQPIEGPQAA